MTDVCGLMSVIWPLSGVSSGSPNRALAPTPVQLTMSGSPRAYEAADLPANDRFYDGAAMSAEIVKQRREKDVGFGNQRAKAAGIG